MKQITKKIIAAFMSLAIITCCFSACAGTPDGKKEKLKIGVIQLIEHDALDAAYDGFKKAMEDAGHKEGVEVEYEFHNAQGEQANCATIADQLAASHCDLILAIATQAAQAVVNKIKDIPILVTAVTDPADAKLVASNEVPGGNVSGTSDLNPIEEQANLLLQIAPKAKNVGLLYCSNEDNSKFQIKIAKEKFAAKGITTTEFTVTQLTEIQSVVESMAGKVDAIYIPTDNIMASGMATVTQSAIKYKLPVIVGESAVVATGGLATCGLSYFNLGKQTAQMAIDILVNGKDVAKMPIQYLSEENYEFAVNTETASALGLTIPQEIMDKAAHYPAVG